LAEHTRHPLHLSLYQIDAFATRPFEGNPAAVCPLDAWLPDALMQAIAMENNLSETAFFVRTDTGFQLRWFTPLREVKLCGHATLASAYVIFNLLNYGEDTIEFDTCSGRLAVTRQGDWLELDFPAQVPHSCTPPPAIRDAFGREPLACLKAEDYLVVFEDEGFVRTVQPDMRALAELDLRGVAITSRSREVDFVTRFFAPSYGINEDPVTGSAFTQLIPYWAQQLGRSQLLARQVSSRGGEVRGVLNGERVLIAGKAVKYLQGVLELSV
jgi:predicted PhzF superfamily epimerase YddE/YHI9